MPVQCSLALALGATAVVVSGGSVSPFANCVGQSASEPSPAVSQTSPPVRLPEPSRETAMATPVDGVSQPPWGRLPLFFGSIVLYELRCCLHRCAFTSHRRIGDPDGEWDQPSQRRQRRRHGLWWCPNCGSQQHVLPSSWRLPLVSIVSGSFGIPLVGCRSAGSRPYAARCPTTPSSAVLSSPRMSGWIGACVGVVAHRSGLRTDGVGENQYRGRGASIREGGVACRCRVCLSVLIASLFACRDLAGGFCRSGGFVEGWRSS